MRSRSKISKKDITFISNIGSKSEPKKRSSSSSNKVSISSLLKKRIKIKQKVKKVKKVKPVKPAKLVKTKNRKVIRLNNGQFITIHNKPKTKPILIKSSKKGKSFSITHSDLRSISGFKKKVNTRKYNSLTHKTSKTSKKKERKTKIRKGRVCLVISRKYWTRLPTKVSVFMVYRTLSGKVTKTHNVLMLHYRYKKNKKLYLCVLMRKKYFELLADRIIKISPYIKSLKKRNREERLKRIK